MRDVVVARRSLLVGAAAIVVGGWSGNAAAKNSAVKHPPAKHQPVKHQAGKPRSVRQHKPLRVVALDPGHGGLDPGAISPHGIFEKSITLAMSRELARELEASGRYRAVLTRRGDTYVPLRRRVERARAGHAELFLSIHADVLPDHAMRGLSVYTLSDQASDREAAALAIRANKDDFVAGVHLSRQSREIGAILLDLAQRHTNNASLALARAVVDELGRDVPLLEKPHRAAGFAVLTAPDTPSALVELGCLSNPEDEHLLQQRGYQRRLARGLLRAIDDYFASAVAS